MSTLSPLCSSWSLASHGRGRTGVETEQLLELENDEADDDDAVEKMDDRHESVCDWPVDVVLTEGLVWCE